MEKRKSPEELRELGKVYLFNSEANKETRNKGILMLLEAKSRGDAEATYIISRLMFDRILINDFKDNEETAMKLMCIAANMGFVQARAFLNDYCRKNYNGQFGGTESDKTEGPLVDFDGNPISFVREGLLTPIDVALEYRNGRNVLSISTNVLFAYGDEVLQPNSFEDAVIKGILAWEGDYEVFGGQKITVEVNVSTKRRLFDGIVVFSIADDFDDMIKISEQLNMKKNVLRDALKGKRSFLYSGLRKWSVRSRKIVCIQSDGGNFNEYEEIMHIVKHEFGHALGLGDLYKSSSDNLSGVPKGTYAELDSYHIADDFYNLVMCDHHGPISNNDIEMVILAFKENKIQHFQQRSLKDKVSYALGKGN